MNRLWLAFIFALVVSFSILGWIGSQIYQELPPIPAQVVLADDDSILIGPGEIIKGQNVWQSMGGMEVGSIWGHGSYVAPDWTADWLHREAVFILEEWAGTDYDSKYDDLTPEQQAQLQGRLQHLLRTNTYDPETGKITIEPVRARA